MKKSILVALIMAFATPALARNTEHLYSYKEVMSSDEAQMKLDQGIKFYFGDQRHPGVARKLGTYVANKKTNALNKSDERACKWAFLSAMRSLQARAVREGGNAVINIQSYYKKHVLNSATEFECGAGAFVAGVALRGTVVKLK